MRIHALLCSYSTPFGIRRALESLRKLHPYLLDVTLIPHPTTHIPLEQVDTRNAACGCAVNIASTCSLTGAFSTSHNEDDYYLVLYDHDYLSPDFPTAQLDILLGRRMLTSPHRILNESCARPLLIHSQTLSRRWGNLEVMMKHDPEAAITAVMHKFSPSEMVSLERSAVKQTQLSRQRGRAEYLRSLAKSPMATRQSNQGEPTMAIAIANYNMAKYLPTVLAALKSQSDERYEVWFIDDGSTDTSIDILHRFIEANPGHHFMKTENQGKARALNTLLPHIQSDFTLELDADDWLDANAIQMIRHHLTVLADDENLLYGNLRTWRADHNGNYRCEGLHHGSQVRSIPDVLSYPLPLGPRIYRTDALKRIGGFPVSTFADGRLYEDVLVVARLLDIGRVHYSDFTAYNTVAHAGSITRQNRAMWHRFLEAEFPQYARRPRE